MRQTPLALLLLLAACGAPAPDAEEKGPTVDIPTPSGPPIAQQADAVPSTAPPPGAADWAVTESERAVVLRLLDERRGLVMVLGCRTGRGLMAVVPSFTQIGSEDRLTVGFGDEAVALAARPPAQGNPGVTAEGGAPPPDVIEEAESVSAVYGAQRLGPLPAPSEALRERLASRCK